MARANSKEIRFKIDDSSYGGILRNTQVGREGPRPLSKRNSIHLVLRSSKARGQWSFALPHHRENIRQVVRKFSLKYKVEVMRLANVGNHLHFEVRVSGRESYNAFIRAICSAIAMVVTGTSRWNPLRDLLTDKIKSGRMNPESPMRFWDYRPFTRIVFGNVGLLRLRDYLRINQLEGYGYGRTLARIIFNRDPDRQRKFIPTG
jgi:hypothetical protein